MSKLFLTSMSNDDVENVSEFYNENILQYFDGVIHVIHGKFMNYYECISRGIINNNLDSVDMDENDKSNSFGSRLDNSKIIIREYVQRNDFSMNEILYCGAMEPGFYFVFADILERVMPDFAKKIKSEIIPLMEANGVDALYFYGKPFVIKYSEYLKFEGSPHWSLRGANKGAEYSHVEKDESKVRLNVRPLKRDKWHFIDHYCRYLLMPPGSNTMLLGLEKRAGGNVMDLFPIVENQRLEFREYLRGKGFPLTVEGVKELIKTPLDSVGIKFFNELKILNDFYRFHILNDKTIVDNHDYSDRVKIE